MTQGERRKAWRQRRKAHNAKRKANGATRILSMLKRLFDIFLSTFGLICSSPLWILFGLAIILEDGLPIFYLQERVGRGGMTFKAIKFRSMIKDAEKGTGPVQAVENDPRVTKVGRILRATAMDELPQL